MKNFYGIDIMGYIDNIDMSLITLKGFHPLLWLNHPFGTLLLPLIIIKNHEIPN